MLADLGNNALARETGSAWDYQGSAWVWHAHSFADREAELTGYFSAGWLLILANIAHKLMMNFC
ncbi:hypothetical protein [Aeromonas salmonicida]|uniref:hypothetical protein n=1 Tax=Aeromonas salmonicida TaxID=645 RepID=UPI003D70795E